MKFFVDQKVFQKLGHVCFGVVVAKGMDNTTKKHEIAGLLEQNIRNIKEQFKDVKIKEHPAILPYRNAFIQLGFNPNKFASSVEALITRVQKGGQIPNINNVVDLVNAMSLKYVLPIGAHDMDITREDIVVRFSVAGDEFIPFGTEEPELLEPGELVYARGNHVNTRRWIWRQSERGKITNKSTNIFFPIDGFIDVNHEAVLSARDELAQVLKDLFNCEVITGYVDHNNQSMSFQ